MVYWKAKFDTKKRGIFSSKTDGTSKIEGEEKWSNDHWKSGLMITEVGFELRDWGSYHRAR